jgi:hypothetical protein
MFRKQHFETFRNGLRRILIKVEMLRFRTPRGQILLQLALVKWISSLHARSTSADVGSKIGLVVIDEEQRLV